LGSWAGMTTTVTNNAARSLKRVRDIGMLS
jgi:hypothetical protein